MTRLRYCIPAQAGIQEGSKTGFLLSQEHGSDE